MIEFLEWVRAHAGFSFTFLIIVAFAINIARGGGE
jgi:hypothetical protein